MNTISLRSRNCDRYLGGTIKLTREINQVTLKLVKWEIFRECVRYNTALKVSKCGVQNQGH